MGSWGAPPSCPHSLLLHNGLWFVHEVTCQRCSLYSWIIFHGGDVPHFVCSSVDGPVGCFRLLAIDSGPKDHVTSWAVATLACVSTLYRVHTMTKPPKSSQCIPIIRGRRTMLFSMCLGWNCWVVRGFCLGFEELPSHRPQQLPRVTFPEQDLRGPVSPHFH